MEDKRGVILVGFPETGEILGAVSKPDFNPDLFTGRIMEKDWNNLINDKNKPLVNRFTQGLYPPGSIVKMITGAVLMDHQDFDPHMEEVCDGAYQYGDRVFGCWNTQGHGKVDLTSAIAQSCDIYFYRTIQYYDIDKLAKYFYNFGFGSIAGLDIEGEAKGTIPTKEYMDKRYGRFGWSTGALLNFSIGQGEILVTPIQVLNYTNILATRGNTFKPHLVRSDVFIENKDSLIPDEHWDRIIFDMGQVVSHQNGTGKNADPLINGVDVYGKTGTAENPHGEDHAWFIGWMSFLDNNYSIVVLLENAGSGGAVAAPIAKTVFNNIISLNNMASK